MEHPSSMRILDHWRDLCGTGHPRLSEVVPGVVREALADSFMLETVDGRGRFVTAGTRLRAVTGHGKVGEAWDDVFADAGTVSAMWMTVTRLGMPCVASPVGNVADGRACKFELLMLPLRNQGRGRGVLGCLVPLPVAPAWTGTAGPMTLVLDGWSPLGATADTVRTKPRHARLVCVGGERVA